MTKAKPSRRPDQTTALARYDASAQRAARQVIATYSSSFSLASRLLRGRVRHDISNLYAMVRIADEIVDGTARAAGHSLADVRDCLDAYEKQVLAAPHARFHTDPVLHAYAITARRCAFPAEHISAFFRSMRWDIYQSSCSDEEFASYVYGSAEVIGLLCLDVFLAGKEVTPAAKETMTDGARRLGAAFQKINFLRDLSDDSIDLGRNYFPQLAGKELTWELKDSLIADVREDLRRAYSAIPLLPLDARVGVQAAADLFAALTDRLDALAPEDVGNPDTRVRIPAPRKALITARAARRAAQRTTQYTAQHPKGAE